MVAAARPLARTFFDMTLPGEAVFDEVRRLVENLGAMHGILRDRSHTSIRLVMNPDRMVVKEAMRTFTYLNLYGYLTDAVVVNRIFGEELAEGYFARWRDAQTEHLELVHSAFSPVPILTAPYFEQEVVGSEMLDRLAGELFALADPAAVMHEGLAQELVTENGHAVLRVPVPLASKGEIELKKIGLEVVVRIGAQKRTIILPSALATYRPAGARFEDGRLEVTFEQSDERVQT